MSEDNLVKAKKAVEELLDILKMVNVVYVDDANEMVRLEDVVDAAQSLKKEQLKNIFPELGESIPDDPDVLRSLITKAWERLELGLWTERGQIVLNTAHSLTDSESKDITYISILCKIIPERWLKRLSPSMWDKQKDQLLEESKTQNTLFLFDRDFANSGGGPEDGIKIIASLLKSDNENLICGLLTHTVSPDTQLEQWKDLSEQYGIDKDRFVVIPKRHLSEEPMHFAQALKFTALSPDFTRLKRQTKDIMIKAATVAGERVEDVSIYDLDNIVFQLSSKEGLWEPDMLFRLHMMFHQHESRKLAHEGGVLESIAMKMRAVSGISITGNYMAIDSTWALQREELYETHDYINNNHLPLELGDIFEKYEGTSNKKYILLVQPCDLMVRKDGRRSPEMIRIPLFEVSLREKGPYYSDEMPYYDLSPSKKWFVNYKVVHFVNCCILDMCVLNQDGLSKLTVREEAPTSIRPAWKKRHVLLSDYFYKKINSISSHFTECKDPSKISQLSSLLVSDDLFSGSLSIVGDSYSISFNCKRIGRLTHSRAIGLLMSYTATLGRPAYDRDFWDKPIPEQ